MARIGIYYHSNLQENCGGVARVSSWLAQQLRVAGHEVFSIVPKGKMGVSAEGCTTLEIPWRQSCLCAKTVAEAIAANGIELVINQSSFSKSALGLSKTRARVITVVHYNPTPIRPPFEKRKVVGNWRGRLWIRLYNWMPKVMDLIERWRASAIHKRVCSFSNAICVLADSYREFYNEWSKRYKVPVVVIGNPIPWDTCALTKGENVVLWVGRLARYEKRVDWLLEIWRRAVGESREWKLILVGDGEERANIEEFARNNNLNVELAGRTDPRPYYERASIFCLTSPLEGFPLVLPESMAYGVVPIVFDSFGAAHDIIKDKQNGFLVEPYNLDAFANVLKSAMTMDLSVMRVRAQEEAIKFSSDKVFARWRKLIDENICG